MGSRELMVTPQQNPLIVLNIDSATSQELPETHIEPILFVCSHTTSGMGLEPDASGAARVCIELGVRTVRTAFINTNTSDLSGRRGDRNPRLESS